MKTKIISMILSVLFFINSAEAITLVNQDQNWVHFLILEGPACSTLYTEDTLYPRQRVSWVQKGDSHPRYVCVKAAPSVNPDHYVYITPIYNDGCTVYFTTERKGYRGYEVIFNSSLECSPLIPKHVRRH